MNYNFKDYKDISIFKHMFEISHICEGLYLGSIFSTDPQIIKENGINDVISLGCYPHPEIIVDNQYYYDIEDNYESKNMEKFFNKSIHEIHQIINDNIKNNKKVLVHCQAGQSRSVSVIITWLMKYHNMAYNDAYNYIKRKRDNICPNRGFIEYMKKL